ncbi:hypothetical protein PRNP1_013910 [Phytophthora ramorum]
MAQVGVCARLVLVARKVVDALSTACCFSSKTRDEIKVRRGSTRDSVVKLGWDVFAGDCGDEDDGGPGSGDEDVLTSLGASYRAWRAYHREKRAHGYTKSRLVDVFRREAALAKQLTRVGGSVEGIECLLMKLEDLESTVAASEEKLGGRQDSSDEDSRNERNEQVFQDERSLRDRMEQELGVLQQRCAVYASKLNEAEGDVLRWTTQYQQLLPELAASNREKQQLAGELRNVKKTAVLMANRQYVLLGANARALEALPRTDDDDKRAYNEVNVGRSML